MTARHLLTATCLQVSAHSFAQNVTLHENRAPLAKVFKEIQRQTGFVFFYDEILLSQATPVTLQLRETPLRRALDSCFSNQPLTYSIIGNTIVIKQREPAHRRRTSSCKLALSE